MSARRFGEARVGVARVSLPQILLTAATPPRVSIRLQDASEALAAGRLDAALHAASDACHEAPDQPEPHYVYGQAWLARNEPRRAGFTGTAAAAGFVIANDGAAGIKVTHAILAPHG